MPKSGGGGLLSRDNPNKEAQHMRREQITRCGPQYYSTANTPAPTTTFQKEEAWPSLSMENMAPENASPAHPQ